MDQQTNRKQLDELDLEFKEILCVIRQHIPYINSNAYLMQCRVWLEKLSNSNVDKVIRNVYLAELCEQIQANKLLPPFNEAPPSGNLKELKKVSRHKAYQIQSTQNEKKASSTSEQGKRHSIAHKANHTLLSNVDEWGYVQPLKSDEDIIYESVRPRKFKNQKCSSPQNLIAGKQTSAATSDKERAGAMGCGEPGSDNNNNDSESEVSLKTITSREIANDDDSWSDLSDTSSGTGVAQEKLDEDNQSKNVSSGEAKEALLSSSGKVSETVPVKNHSDNMSNIQTEPNSKLAKDTDYISQDWKQTIAALQLRLSEMIHQNKELNVIIQKLELQLEDDKIKNKVQIEQNLKIAENLHTQEIAKLKEMHAEKMLQMEKSFKTNTENLQKDHQENIKKISDNYEQKILEIKRQHEEVINKKDNEICRLAQIIQDQCLRIMNDISILKNQVSNCSCEKRVHVLKKCVSKMDKLFQKSEKDYLKQIEQLRQELELKESSLKVQLKMQKAELIAQTRSGQKEEFEEILNSLEVKYIKMLEGHEHQIMRMKKQDNEKIKYLSELLDKHGISYNDNIQHSNH